MSFVGKLINCGYVTSFEHIDSDHKFLLWPCDELESIYIIIKFAVFFLANRKVGSLYNEHV